MIQLLCMLGIDVDREFIPHHMAHYAARGVTSFHYMLHTASDEEDQVREVTTQLQDIASALQVALSIPGVWHGEFVSQKKVRHLIRLVRKHAVKQEPFLTIDMDEFLILDDIAQTFKDYPHGACIYGTFYDAFAADYPCVAEVLPDVPILEQFPHLRKNWALHAGCCGNPKKPVIIRDANFGDQHKHPTFSFKAFQKRRKKPLTIAHVRWTTSRAAKSALRHRTFQEAGARHWVSSAQTVAVLKTLPTYEREPDGNVRTEDS